MATTRRESATQASALRGAPSSLARRCYLRRKFDGRRRSCRGCGSRVGGRRVARPRFAELDQRLLDLEIELVELAEQLVVPRFETVQQFAGSWHGVPAGGQFGRERQERMGTIRTLSPQESIGCRSTRRLRRSAPPGQSRPLAWQAVAESRVMSPLAPPQRAAGRPGYQSPVAYRNFACSAGCASRNGWRGRLHVQAVEWRIPVR